jgi:hypothetical protein
MVRALLADGIEREVTVDNVHQKLVDQFLPRVSAELRGPRAEQAAAIFVGPRKKKGAKKLADASRARAEQVRQWLLEDPTYERLISFDTRTVKAPLGGRVRRSLHVVEPSTPRNAMPKGWLKSKALYHTLRQMEVGEVSEPLVIGAGFAVLLRQEPVLPDSSVSDEEVEHEARIRARDALRATHLEHLIRDLRKKADIEKYPALIEQQQKQKQ